jgi:hypothetical protein
VKLHVKFDANNIKVDEIISGDTAEAVVGAMQARVAKELGLILGAVVRNMSPLAFAQEATRRYNAASGDTAPVPQSCQQFLQYGVSKGFATVLEGGNGL